MQLFSNNAASVLASGITNSATSLTVTAGTGIKFPVITGSDFFLVTLCQISGTTEVNHEVIKVTARSTDTLTLMRAQEGTTALAFNAGDKVELRITKGSIELISGAVGGASNKAFYENDQTVTADYTITAGKNAMTAGPITINTGVTVTVPTGATWSIV